MFLEKREELLFLIVIHRHLIYTYIPKFRGHTFNVKTVTVILIRHQVKFEQMWANTKQQNSINHFFYKCAIKTLCSNMLKTLLITASAKKRTIIALKDLAWTKTWMFNTKCEQIFKHIKTLCVHRLKKEICINICWWTYSILFFSW